MNLELLNLFSAGGGVTYMQGSGESRKLMQKEGLSLQKNLYLILNLSWQH